MNRKLLIIVGLLAALAGGCAKSPPASVSDSKQVGYASWYGKKFHGRKTASGEVYNMYAKTAAHKTLPFQTRVRVHNLDNGRSTIVRVNDRGPFIRGRIIDLSYTSAKEIGLVASGTAKVRLEFLQPEPVAKPIPKPTPEPKVEQEPGTFYVQIGSFQYPENAHRMLDELKGRFPEKPAQVKDSQKLYRVWVGPIGTEAQAQNLAETLREAGYNGLVLRP